MKGKIQLRSHSLFYLESHELDGSFSNSVKTYVDAEHMWSCGLLKYMNI